MLFNNSNELNFDYLIQDIFFLETLNNYTFLKVAVSIFVSILVATIYSLCNSYFSLLTSNNEKLFFAFLLSCATLFSFLYFFRIFFLSRLYVLIFVFVLTTVTITFNRFKALNIIFVALLFLINVGTILLQEINTIEEAVSEEVLSIPEYILEEEFLSNDYEYLKFVYTDSKLLLQSKVKLSDSYIFKYIMCCEDLDYEKMKKKSIGYLESHENNLIYATGSGFISYLNSEISELENYKYSFKTIPSNFHEIVKNKYISTYKNDVTSLNKESIKGMVIVNNKIYLSYINEPKENCVNVEVVFGDLNYDFIEFKPFFQPTECILRDNPIFNSHAAGGKLVVIDKNHIGLTIGDFNIFGLSQNPNSIFGKIYSINTLNSEKTLLSSGHRNPQGLHKVFGRDVLIETEHGPRGGDEINLININKFENYGWPISSYGTHYSEQYYEDYGDEAPLNQSHSDFGFKEPLKYFPFNEVGPHGISDVEAVYGKEDTFFVATLYGKKIYEVKINFESQTIESFRTYYVGERIRDIEYNEQNKLYYILMEDSPALGILEY